MKLLISCKRYKRKLNQQDIDAFNGELLSSGAHKGIIYSYSGFGKNAVEKAQKIGICCCTLYKDQAPEIPEILKFHAYCFIPKYTTENVKALKNHGIFPVD
ncbi:MAG: restriction endonuclease [Acidobacteria bacterium]|nr:restriction endonuclease [Acidobacteriota bacterium]